MQSQDVVILQRNTTSENITVQSEVYSTFMVSRAVWPRLLYNAVVAIFITVPSIVTNFRGSKFS